MIKKTGNPSKTVLTITIGFAIVFLLTKMDWALITSISVGLLGVISDKLSEYIEYLWLKLAWLLGLIVPNILLSIIFYFFLFPLSLLSKLFGKKNPLNLKRTEGSMWISYDREIDIEYFEKTW
ncbi:MAG: hypothetical protein QNK23_02130 [Crocinitomicaceae bacterium]|nr:hypothetical protein [Crocinitomicaceae bacterium]